MENSFKRGTKHKYCHFRKVTDGSPVSQLVKVHSYKKKHKLTHLLYINLPEPEAIRPSRFATLEVSTCANLPETNLPFLTRWKYT
jgi:hypothetical protein